MTMRARTIEVPASDLHALVAQTLQEGYRLALVAAHDDVDVLRVVYVFTSESSDHCVELIVRIDSRDPHVPTLSDVSFPASRFEREMHDTFGIIPDNHPFLRPLVRHSHWPENWYALRRNAGDVPIIDRDGPSYPFIEVAGTGVYEIPVGPVHAGLIEPGHFRFSVVGETILKLTSRLWFTHRGIERLFQGVGLHDGVSIAERISGDTAVGHSLAYAMAIEEGQRIDVSNDARVVRSTLLELERIYNHVGDLGAMCSDVSFGVAHARAMVIRESLLRLNDEVTGHRLLRGAIFPGSTVVRRLPTDRELDGLESDVNELVDFIVSNSMVVDRFEGTAVLSTDDARAIGTLGVVARASGYAIDARATHPYAPGDEPQRIRVQSQGDVMARFAQRVDEIRDSIKLIRLGTSYEPRLDSTSTVGEPGPSSGLGVVEGWRGTIVHRVEVDANANVARCSIVDPSFFNWPALSVSMKDTIVPDFPLVNKSFNLSYAGNDL